MKLVIVESPAKAKTIEKYLGKGYTVRASVGHIRDLPKSNKDAVDIEGGFVPRYQIVKEKQKIIDELKEIANKSTEVILATDPDREGEAIAYHLAETIGLKKPKRIVFHEITKPAILNAIENPRTVDIKLWRENREMTVKVKVAALQEEEEKVAAAPTRGETAKASEKIAPLGVTVAEIDDRAREKYTLEKDAKGVVITDVEPGGPAGEAGIKPGEVIVEIGQERITSPAQFAAKVKDLKGAGGKPVLLLVEGDSGLRFVAVRPATG